MSLMIPYESQNFPSEYGLGFGILRTSWNDLLRAALTVGRPNTAYVFRHGEASLYEARFRISLIRMAVEQGQSRRLKRTTAFAALDPTEKGAVSYFLGLTLCKLFASQLLDTPWLLHLDVFRDSLNPALLGRSRPDLVGQNSADSWHAFESKGRSGPASDHDIERAKHQARRLVSVNGNPCSLHVGTFAYFRSNALQFYWCDPEPEGSSISLVSPKQQWRYYYEPAFALASNAEASAGQIARRPTGVLVEIHSEIYELLSAGRWNEAHETARQNRKRFEEEEYQPDGLRVKADESWQQPFESIEP